MKTWEAEAEAEAELQRQMGGRTMRVMSLSTLARIGCIPTFHLHRHPHALYFVGAYLLIMRKYIINHIVYLPAVAVAA